MILLDDWPLVALPRGFTVGGSGELRWTDYAGNWFPHTTGGESREDRTYSTYSATIWMRARVASFKNVPEFSDRCLTKMFLSRS